MKPTRRTFMQTLGLLPFFKPAVDSIKMRPPVEKVLNEDPIMKPSKDGSVMEIQTACTMQMFPVTGGDKHGLPEVQYVDRDGDKIEWDHTGQSPVPWPDTDEPMG
jgi:hypothetical protein